MGEEEEVNSLLQEQAPRGWLSPSDQPRQQIAVVEGVNSLQQQTVVAEGVDKPPSPPGSLPFGRRQNEGAAVGVE